MRFLISRAIILGAMFFVYLSSFAVNFSRHGNFQMLTDTYLLASVIAIVGMVIAWEIQDLRREVRRQ